MIRVVLKEMIILALPDHFKIIQILSFKIIGHLIHAIQIYHHLNFIQPWFQSRIPHCPQPTHHLCLHPPGPAIKTPHSPDHGKRGKLEKNSRQWTIYRPCRLVFPFPYSPKKNQNHKKKSLQPIFLALVLLLHFPAINMVLPRIFRATKIPLSVSTRPGHLMHIVPVNLWHLPPKMMGCLLHPLLPSRTESSSGKWLES